MVKNAVLAAGRLLAGALALALGACDPAVCTPAEGQDGGAPGARRSSASSSGAAAAMDAPAPHRAPLPDPAALAQLPPDGGPEFNRLIFENSPYLLQHARNPVDWYPWGAEAFAKAAREDRPIFLSVGYSTCHWCHVMERESFENPAIAELLNAHFVPIKADREERPDVDALSMAAVQTLTGSGGWPTSLFLTPDRRPFWGGTYFPPEDRYGRPGFATVLTAIAARWRDDRAGLLTGAERLTAHLRSAAGAVAGAGRAAGDAALDPAPLAAAAETLRAHFDAVHGGFGGAPKFPRAHTLSLLLRRHRRTGDAQALAMVEITLERMARGGIHDHLAGGFHRYSTDAEWLVPHFEKMLYDQALLARAYLEAYQVTGTDAYADAARDIFAYVLRDLTDREGGFQCAEDADSEGEEGKFAVWTRDEMLAVLGPEDGALFAAVYGVEARGNFREEATGVSTGRNILHLPRPIAEVAPDRGLDPAALAARLAPLRERLFAARRRRVGPFKDDKVLADWNGLMISALAAGARVLGEPRYAAAARRAAAFVRDAMQREGRLLHTWRGGRASVGGFLDDYAFFALGLLDLYEATFEVRWLREAQRLAHELPRLFGDADGGFRLSGTDAEAMLVPAKDLYDGALPSGNSVATLLLLRLGRLTGDAALERAGRANLEHFAGVIARSPEGVPYMLMALDFALGPVREVVLAGAPDDPAFALLRRTVDQRFLPNTVIAHRPPDAVPGEAAALHDAAALIPYLADQRPPDDRATAFVCENYACALPTGDPARLAALLSDTP